MKQRRGSAWGALAGALLVFAACSGKTVSSIDGAGGTSGTGTTGGKAPVTTGNPGGGEPETSVGGTANGGTARGGTDAKGGAASTTAGAGGTLGKGGAGGVSGGANGGAGGGAGANAAGKCGPNSVKHPDGLCYCQPATLSACKDGCADFATDADHCGDCDTECNAMAACGAGKCLATPTTLLKAPVVCGSMSLVVASGTLFWTNQQAGTVESLPIGGGAVASLVTGQLGPTHIEVRGARMYWLATGSTAVMTATITGSNPKVVAQGAADIGGFTLSADGTALYYAEGTKIRKVDAPDGGALTEIGYEDTGIPRALALSGHLLAFPTYLNGDVDVMTLVDGALSVCASPDSLTAVNKNCARVARSQGGLDFASIYLLDNQAYWMNDVQVVTSPADVPTGVNATVVTAGNPNAIKSTAMSIVNKVVYLADDTGYIYKAPLMNDSTATTIARGQCTADATHHCANGPSSITADDTHVYWASGDCAIRSLPLP